MLTDNAGLIIAGMIRIPANNEFGFGGFILRTGTIVSLRTYAFNNSLNPFNLISGGGAQVGKGTTPATRQDFDIEDPFITAPESLVFATSPNGYVPASGIIQFPALLASTGAGGIITEVCRYVNWRSDTTQEKGTFMVAHDIISPSTFIIGQQIFVEHEIQI